jgi:hypothetical protein
MCCSPPLTHPSRVSSIIIPNEQTFDMNENPYSGHRLLSEKEQEVLGEYARLAGTIRRVSVKYSEMETRFYI